MSSDNLEEILPSTHEERRAVLTYLARFAENIERYTDMCFYMKELIKYVCEHDPKGGVSVEERNLLSVAYKNVVGTRRTSWRQIPSDDPDGGITIYRQQVENELESTCLEVIGILECCLKLPEDLAKGLRRPTEDEEEARVFYLKMAGDYYRYLSEFRPRSSGFQEKAKSYYHQALDVACGYVEGWKALAPTHPIRLGLALNFSVCYYEILGERENACHLAMQAFEEALVCLDALDEASYKDTTLIMGLLHDNLSLWEFEPKETTELYDE